VPVVYTSVPAVRSLVMGGETVATALSVQLPPGQLTAVTWWGCTASTVPLRVPDPDTRLTPVKVLDVVPV
jgi:hypothetical protein